MKPKCKIMALTLISAIGLAAVPAHAQETTTYTYDALGRVVTVGRSGGPVNGSTTNYAYDPASNRTNVTVSNSPNGSANGSNSGATTTVTKYVIVPLNGYTVIPFQQ